MGRRIVRVCSRTSDNARGRATIRGCSGRHLQSRRVVLADRNDRAARGARRKSVSIPASRRAIDPALTGVERTRPESDVMRSRSLHSRMDSAETVALRIGRYLYFSFPIPALAEAYLTRS